MLKKLKQVATKISDKLNINFHSFFFVVAPIFLSAVLPTPYSYAFNTMVGGLVVVFALMTLDRMEYKEWSNEHINLWERKRLIMLACMASLFYIFLEIAWGMTTTNEEGILHNSMLIDWLWCIEEMVWIIFAGYTIFQTQLELNLPTDDYRTEGFVTRVLKGRLFIQARLVKEGEGVQNTRRVVCIPVADFKTHHRDVKKFLELIKELRQKGVEMTTLESTLRTLL